MINKYNIYKMGFEIPKNEIIVSIVNIKKI